MNPDVQKLQTLLQLSQSLADPVHLLQSLRNALKLWEESPQVVSTLITLTDNGHAPLQVGSKGPNSPPATSFYRSAEAIVTSVIKARKPVVVPRLSLEPSFVAKARQRKELKRFERSLICVPITVNKQCAAALSVQLRYRQDRDYSRGLDFLQVVASMIAPAIKISRLVEAERRSLLQENIQLREELKERYDFSNIVGNSRAMRPVYQGISQVARANTTVLIRGESGTGKELIAHSIHYNSHRQDGPFVGVNCAALPETLIEAELFGHERGAFTGARTQKKGRFEMANGGTLFLDEIGELDPSLQVKLLRVLQSREFERLGGTHTIRCDVRLIVATNQDLEGAIADGRFREDLYYRINVFSIFLPPLRERQSDILLLADHFLEKYAAENRKPIKRISTPAIDMLSSYHWPGNVRELENVIERAVLVCDSQVIHSHHLPPTLQTAEASGTTVRVQLQEALAAYERDLIQDALKTTKGNRARAARLLGTTERIIGYKVKKHGIDCRRFRLQHIGEMAKA